MTRTAIPSAVILAGGLGTRLSSVVSDRPKVMASIHGKPFVVYLLEQLKGAGINHAILCVGHMGQKIREALGNSYHGLTLEYSWEKELLGTGGAIRLASVYLRSETALILNGDSYCQLDIDEFSAFHQLHKSRASIALTQVENAGRYGLVQLNQGGEIISFKEKGQPSSAGWINAGLYLIQREVIVTIPVDKAVSIEHDVFPKWIGKSLFGFKGGGRFLDIGTPESYAAAESFFAQI